MDMCYLSRSFWGDATVPVDYAIMTMMTTKVELKIIMCGGISWKWLCSSNGFALNNDNDKDIDNSYTQVHLKFS